MAASCGVFVRASTMQRANNGKISPCRFCVPERRSHLLVSTLLRVAVSALRRACGRQVPVHSDVALGKHLCACTPPCACHHMCASLLLAGLICLASIMLAHGATNVVVLQVREQDVKLQRNTARLEALSLALFSAKANLQAAGGADLALPCSVHGPTGGASFNASKEGGVPAPNINSLPHGPSSDVSAAHRFYLQLKANCTKQACESANAASLGAVPLCRLDAAEEEAACTEPEAFDLLASLKLAVADAVAENMALSSTDQGGGSRCSFTTRHCGLCTRVHVEDMSSDPLGARVAISCDMFLAGACRHATTLHTEGLSAENVVQQAFWPVLARRTASAKNVNDMLAHS